ncbi:hypothetical protein ASD15_13935 [Massilia sp. Root351]|nr:hypothetical protein ASD15_13935 [Massilia sp. Root351]
MAAFGQMQTFEIGTANLDVDMRTYETFEDAKLLAQEILSNRMNAKVGCALIASIAAKLRYPSECQRPSSARSSLSSTLLTKKDFKCP